MNTGPSAGGLRSLGLAGGRVKLGHRRSRILHHSSLAATTTRADRPVSDDEPRARLLEASTGRDAGGQRVGALLFRDGRGIQLGDVLLRVLVEGLGALGATAPSILNTSRTTTSPVPLVSKNKLEFEFLGLIVVPSN